MMHCTSSCGRATTEGIVNVYHFLQERFHGGTTFRERLGARMHATTGCEIVGKRTNIYKNVLPHQRTKQVQ